MTVRRSIRMKPKAVRKKIIMRVRRATRDGVITKMELRKIRMATGGKGAMMLTQLIKRAAMKEPIRIGMRKPSNNKPSNNKPSNNKPTTGNKPQVLERKPTVVDGKSKTKTGKMPKIGTKKDRRKDKKYGQRKDKILKKNTLDVPNSSKDYRKYDYDKETDKAEKLAKMQDKALRKIQRAPMRIYNKKQTRKAITSIGSTTGYNKIRMRISATGRLKDKKGSVKAMAPSYEKFQKERAKIMSPYAGKFKKIGRKLEVKYGDKARTERTRMRLSSLTMRLTGNVFGDANKSGYGDKGIDRIQKFTETNVPKPKPKPKGPVQGKKKDPSKKYGLPESTSKEKYGR